MNIQHHITHHIHYIIILCILILTPVKSWAQVGEARNDLTFGFNAGYAMNKMDFSPTIKQTYKGSPTLGVTARYICEKYFTMIAGVQVEVNYVNLGWKELIEDGTDNTYSRDMSYISVPLLMHMGWGREKRGCKFVFLAGPQFEYNLGSTEHFGGNHWDTSHRPNNVTGQYGLDVDHKIDYGIEAGAGIEFSTSIGHFILDGRYYYGLSDVFDNSKRGIFARSANGTISVKLHYLMDISKTKR